MDITINYRGEPVELTLSFGRYGNGQVAIQSYADDGPFATLTEALSLPPQEVEKLEGNNLIIIHHDLDALIPELVLAGLISEPKHRLYQGYAAFTVVELLMSPE